MRASIYTLGCKVNQFESEAISEQLKAAGFEIVDFGQEAELFLVNTCCVTSKAAYQSRQILRRIRRTWPKARLVVTGCYVQTGSQEILDKVKGPICLVGNDQKHRLVELITEKRCCLEVFVGSIERVKKIAPLIITRPAQRTRAFVRIQDGCNAFCSYCIVPYARGRSRSLPPKLVKRQIEILERHQVKEVVLTGIHLGHYGLDLEDGTNLFSLIRSLCEQFPEMRFRFSSIEPTEISDEMISWATSTPNFCPHWHLPLQSGSDRVLSAMNRRYNARLYMEVVLKINQAMPDAAIGADVMVGFPKEKIEDFELTVELLRSLPITYVHAFPYSPRPGTLAYAYKNKDPVSGREKARRSRIIRKIGSEKKKAFYKAQEGRIYHVLFEHPIAKDKAPDHSLGWWKGLTPNYIPVLVKGSDSLKNRIKGVRLKTAKPDYVIGDLA